MFWYEKGTCLQFHYGTQTKFKIYLKEIEKVMGKVHGLYTFQKKLILFEITYRLSMQTLSNML